MGNGILLCSMHHHRVHRDGWGIRITDSVPWFIPPSTVDIYRTPRRGGRLPVPELTAPELTAPELTAPRLPAPQLQRLAG
jgi:hypothetical protein